MKKLTAFFLATLCVFGLAACSGSGEKVWDWTQSLEAKDIASAQIWNDNDWTERSLTEEEIRELVMLLNGLPKDSFTHNKHLRGGTSTYGIGMEIASVHYSLHEANGPHGTLEMEYDGKLWWIDDEALSSFVQKVAGTTATV